MRISLKAIISSLSLLLIAFTLVSPVFADLLDKIQIIKISARDKQAIVRMDDGKMRILKVGEEIVIRPGEESVASEKDTKQNPADRQMMAKERKASGADKEARTGLTPGETKSEREKIGGPENRPVSAKNDIATGRKATVEEIAAGRIVLEEKTKSGLETIILRLAPKDSRAENKAMPKDNGGIPETKTTIERISKKPEQQSTFLLKNQGSGDSDIKRPDKGMTGKDVNRKKD